MKQVLLKNRILRNLHLTVFRNTKRRQVSCSFYANMQHAVTDRKPVINKYHGQNTLHAIKATRKLKNWLDNRLKYCKLPNRNQCGNTIY